MLGGVYVVDYQIVACVAQRTRYAPQTLRKRRIVHKKRGQYPNLAVCTASPGCSFCLWNKLQFVDRFLDARQRFRMHRLRGIERTRDSRNTDPRMRSNVVDGRRHANNILYYAIAEKQDRSVVCLPDRAVRAYMKALTTAKYYRLTKLSRIVRPSRPFLHSLFKIVQFQVAMPNASASCHSMVASLADQPNLPPQAICVRSLLSVTLWS